MMLVLIAIKVLNFSHNPVLHYRQIAVLLRKTCQKQPVLAAQVMRWRNRQANCKQKKTG